MKEILVTGGAGYIGSHTVIELLENNFKVIVVDDLSNSSKEALLRIEKMTNKSISFYKIDIRNKKLLSEVFKKHNIDSVIHFAGLKAVADSVKNPFIYYDVNINSTLSLLSTMKKFKVKKMIFSSSATVYGSSPIPYTENSPTGQGISNPYGKTKYMIEQIIKDISMLYPDNSYTILRYFNPIGAHESGKIGEDPNGIPNNLMPFISQVASGKRDKLSIFGGNYDTPDGTCIRDYIHVVDLAKGHLAAIKRCKSGYNIYNLGSGVGISVLELVNVFIKSTGQNITYEIVDRRPGDLPEFYANPDKALKELGWKTNKTVEDACRDSWNWQSKNPNGYQT